MTLPPRGDRGEIVTVWSCSSPVFEPARVDQANGVAAQLDEYQAQPEQLLEIPLEGDGRVGSWAAHGGTSTVATP